MTAHALRRARPAALALTLALSIPWAASADIVIESHGADGKPARVLIADSAARIERDGQGVHLLIEFGNGRVLAVDDAGRYAMDMRSPMPPRPEHGELDPAAVPIPEVRIEPHGDGPTIAGLATRHFRVLVDGRHCYDEYLAPAALEHAPVRRFLEAMAAVSRNDERRILLQLTDPERICEAAEDLIDDHYAELGVPMRTIDADARVVHEVARVDLRAAHDPDLFSLPEDYDILTRQQVMERSLQQQDGSSIEQRRQRIERHMREYQGEVRATTPVIGAAGGPR